MDPSKSNELKIGDKVKITHRPSLDSENFITENLFKIYWNPKMDSIVGKTSEILSISKNGVRLKCI